MRLLPSKYNKIFEITDTVMCIHNSISGFFYYFDKANKNFRDDTIIVDQLDTNTLKLFRSKLLLIDENIDEVELLHQQFIKSINDRTVARITITPTLSCNLDCEYCFVNSSSHVRKRLTHENCQVLCDWIKLKLSLSEIRHLFVNFYGGEPLLETDVILNIMSEISEACRNNNKTICFHIYTNGLLLDKKIITLMYSYGLNEIQISLDENRITKNSLLDSLFSKVLIINKSCPELKITMRINIDEKFKNYLPILFMHHLFNEVYHNNNLYFAPIFEKNAYNGDKSFGGSTISYSKILESAIKYSYDEFMLDFTQLGSCRKFPCYTQCVNSYVISPDLQLYNCHSHLLEQTLSVGSLIDGKSKVVEYDPFEDKHCSKCRLLPTCMGECYMHYKNVNHDRTNCNMNEDLIHLMLKIKYKLGRLE